MADDTGAELLEVGDFHHEIHPGQRVRIRAASCLLRKREMGIEISTAPVVMNDGWHFWRPEEGEVWLPEGKIPLRLDWFNYRRSFALDLESALTNEPRRAIASSSLVHAVINEAGETNFLPGLIAECFEGSWRRVPYVNLLQPVKTRVVTNFDLSVRPRDEQVGIRYSGFLKIPRAGQYHFTLSSDDGAILMLGNPNVPVEILNPTESLGFHPDKLFDAEINDPNEQRWGVAEGRVSFLSRIGKGVKFDLKTGRQNISVQMADATDLDLSALQNARVRVTGIAHTVMTSDQTLVWGKLVVADAGNLEFIERALSGGELKLPIPSAAQVQSLPIDRARQGLPVRLRGTVTGAMKTSQEHWMSFQDETRGIFVNLIAISNSAPAFGELWEVEGHSDAGDFAPVVIADKITRLGEGLPPPPVTPTWTELLNGSRDVQWAELKGLVTEVHSNTVSLHLPEGRLDVELEDLQELDLRRFLKAVIRIRGVLYAVWDAATREVRVGRVMMRNASISVEIPPSMDPFEAVVKTPRELLLFDAQASAFRPVKVRGQVVYADSTQLFMEANGTGLRLLPMEKTDFQPGDLIEAVGYPDLGRTQLLLREALLRRKGHAPLPVPKKMNESGLSQESLNSTRVRVEGKLLGWHTEQGTPVLEMQSGARLYLARIAPGQFDSLSLRPGSRLALDGVYVGRGHNQNSKGDNESFELLLNSPADITVLSQPSWWTLPRLAAMVAVLLVILIFTIIWNTQLRRLVEQRTHQLQREIRERERVEHQHALEAERSRIARDLHDDLGSSLTEITVLASTGQLPQTGDAHQPDLFQTIGAKARGLISALDGIVWAVDPEDNSLQSLADYLSGYTAEFFSHTPVACRFKVPMSFPSITIEGRVRHDVLMTVKEALNNIVRHANATEVEFRMAMTEGNLAIEIADNGKGIPDTTPSGGHGLKNLSARLQKLGGDCVVESRAGDGTNIKIRLPLGIPANAASDLAEKR